MYYEEEVEIDIKRNTNQGIGFMMELIPFMGISFPQ